MAIPVKQAQAFSAFQITRIKVYLMKQPTNQLEFVKQLLNEELKKRYANEGSKKL